MLRRAGDGDPNVAPKLFAHWRPIAHYALGRYCGLLLFGLSHGKKSSLAARRATSAAYAFLELGLALLLADGFGSRDLRVQIDWLAVPVVNPRIATLTVFARQVLPGQAHNMRAQSVMVAVAMEENWDVCKAHIDCIIGITRSVIADGVASGEFHTSDIGVAALCTCTAMMRFFHPQLIAEFANKPSSTLDQMIDFVIAGLSAPAK